MSDAQPIPADRPFVAPSAAIGAAALMSPGEMEAAAAAMFAEGPPEGSES